MPVICMPAQWPQRGHSRGLGLPSLFQTAAANTDRPKSENSYKGYFQCCAQHCLTRAVLPFDMECIDISTRGGGANSAASSKPSGNMLRGDRRRRRQGLQRPASVTPRLSS